MPLAFSLNNVKNQDSIYIYKKQNLIKIGYFKYPFLYSAPLEAYGFEVIRQKDRRKKSKSK